VALAAWDDYSHRLCQADAAAIWRLDGDLPRAVATIGASTERVEFTNRNPIVPDQSTVSGRATLEGKVVLADPQFTGFALRGKPGRGLPVLAC
jgi:hypothetical protein